MSRMTISIYDTVEHKPDTAGKCLATWWDAPTIPHVGDEVIVGLRIYSVKRVTWKRVTETTEYQVSVLVALSPAEQIKALEEESEET